VNGLMQYKALIFDLFGTLIPNFSGREYHLTVEEMAHILDVPAEIFHELWSATFYEAVVGILPDPPARIIHICRKLGISPSEEKIKKAVRVRFDYEKKTMIPRPEAISILAALKASQFKLGLISDCTYEAPAIWKDTSLSPMFDTTVFSCLVGMRKPDPRIYRVALEQLSVSAAECIYIGDGSSRELTGARAVGLRAVLLRIPTESGPDVYRIDQEDWQGEVIESLEEVPNLLGPA
jgi:putative hydrolase of the HAD superfamily